MISQDEKRNVTTAIIIAYTILFIIAQPPAFLNIQKGPFVVRQTDLLMARPGGFEPSTYRFVAGPSIH